MVSELKKLPDDTESLKQIITSQQHQIDHLQEMVGLLQNEIFGCKSEVRALVNPDQLQLFTPPEAPELVQRDETIEIEGHARKKRGRKPLPKDLCRVDIVHDIPDEKKAVRLRSFKELHRGRHQRKARLHPGQDPGDSPYPSQVRM